MHGHGAVDPGETFAGGRAEARNATLGRRSRNRHPRHSSPRCPGAVRRRTRSTYSKLPRMRASSSAESETSRRSGTARTAPRPASPEEQSSRSLVASTSDGRLVAPLELDRETADRRAARGGRSPCGPRLPVPGVLPRRRSRTRTRRRARATRTPAPRTDAARRGRRKRGQRRRALQGRERRHGPVPRRVENRVPTRCL